ncbi:hypothetical protein NBRC116597_07710 [Phaeobacter sp. NW0010-22]
MQYLVKVRDMIAKISRQVRAILGLTVLGLTPGLAVAEMPVIYKNGGQSLFEVSAPDYWQVRAGGPRVISPPDLEEERLINRVIGFSPVSDQGAWVGFMSPNGVRTFDQAVEYLRNVGKSIVEDPVLVSEKKTRIGGLSAAKYAGHGRRGRKTVNFTAVLIDLPQDRVAISIAILEAGVDPEMINDINAIYSSFRSLR